MIDGEFQLGDHIIQNSGKMVVLDKLLGRIKAKGEKVLVLKFLLLSPCESYTR